MLMHQLKNRFLIFLDTTTTTTTNNESSPFYLFDLPSDDKADPVSLLQDSFEFRNSVSARPLEGDLVRDPDDLDRFWIAGDLPVWNWDHVIQTQGFSW